MNPLNSLPPALAKEIEQIAIKAAVGEVNHVIAKVGVGAQPTMLPDVDIPAVAAEGEEVKLN